MFNNSKDVINAYFSDANTKEADFVKRENSNLIRSLSGLRHSIDNYIEEKYLLSEILSPEVTKLYTNGDIYIHDRKLSPYCVSISAKDIAASGIPTIAKNMIESKPAKRVNSLMRHFSNVVVLISQQVSGAVMLSQMTTIIASYLKVLPESVEYDDLVQLFQSLIWELNMPLRSGNQSPFSNVTLEFGKPSPEIANEYVIYAGKLLTYKYSDIEPKYFDFVNKAFIDAMSTGANGIPFTFPLITVPIDDDFRFDNELFIYLLEKMYKWGGVYFENFRTKPFETSDFSSLNPMIKPRDIETSRSLCCRLQIDLSLLSKVGGGIFGNSTGNTGAVQVININMNRLLLRYKYEFNNDIQKTKEELYRIMTEIQGAHTAKRDWILTNKDLYPTFFSFNKDLRNYFNVFSVTGFHEGLINIGYESGLKDPEAQKLTHDLLQYIHSVLEEFIVRDKVACGLEYAPAENAGIKMARDDIKWAKKNYGINIFTQGVGNEVYLTSGAMLPFSETNMIDQIDNASRFQAYGTSGSILHLFLEDSLTPERISSMIDKIFSRPIIYMTLTPTLTTCMSCKNQVIAKDASTINTCPVCGSDDLATFSRVIGYVKMIARKNVRIENDSLYNGDYTFWSKARLYDWTSRKRVTNDDRVAIEEGLHLTSDNHS